MSPTLVVVLTWAAAVAWIIVIGGFASALTRRSVGGMASVRVAMWTGLAILILALIVINLAVPLTSTGALVTLGVLTAVAGAAWVLIEVRNRRLAPPAPTARAPFRWWAVVVVATFAAVVLVLAHAAFGAIENWDVGLYHLNAIQYAAQYPTVPGLANLNSRLGTNGTSSLVGALGTNTPWGLDAVRMLVGLFVSLLAVEVSLRLLDGRMPVRRLPGTAVLLLASAAALAFLLASPAAWVTAPTPDSVALVVGIVAGAYLVDAVVSRQRVWASLAVLVAVLAGTVRTQMWIAAGVTVVLVLVLAWRRSRVPRRRPRAFTLVVGALSALLVAGMLVRDAVLSGWLVYPLGLLPVPVDWRVSDPSVARDWILSWARDPTRSPEEVLGSWSWFGDWLRRTASDSLVMVAVGLLAFALLLWLAARAPRRPGAADVDAGDPDRVVLLAGVPSLVGLLAWFLTAPDPRFASASLLLIGAIPAVWALRCLTARLTDADLSREATDVVAAGIGILLVAPAAVSGVIALDAPLGDGWEPVVYSFGPVDVVAAVHPVPVPEVRAEEITGGGTLLVPVADDRCFATFPLCGPTSGTTLRMRGTDVAHGFAPVTPG